MNCLNNARAYAISDQGPAPCPGICAAGGMIGALAMSAGHSGVRSARICPACRSAECLFNPFHGAQWRTSRLRRGQVLAPLLQVLQNLVDGTGPSMLAIIFIDPPHRSQCSTSIPNTRFSRSAQPLRAAALTPPPCAAEAATRLSRPPLPGTICARLVELPICLFVHFVPAFLKIRTSR